jgi:hypothetical protein
MTYSQLLPPVKPNEAVAVAEVILNVVQGRGWNPDLRGRLQSSLTTLRLEQLTVYPQTLVPDPGHASTYYILVSNAAGDWLLHIAPATAATTPLFPKPMLLARVRPSGEREIVVNAVDARAEVRTILQGLFPTMLPRTAGMQQIWSRAEGIQEFFDGFAKRPNLLPGLRAVVPGWALHLEILLSRWSDGYVAMLEKMTAVPGASELEPYSRFSYLAGDLADARRIANFYTELKTVRRQSFDLELDLSEHQGLDLDVLHGLLDDLKLMGVTVQGVEVSSDVHVPAFAMALQGRQIGITVAGLEPEPNAVRWHWKA